MLSRAAIVCLLFVVACDRQAGVPAQANGVTPDEVTAAPAAPPLAAGKVDRSRRGEAAPTGAFTDAAGRRTTLADFRGRPVLLNLWATWCAPCIAEMPTLDVAAGAAGGRYRVVAVSQDLRPEQADGWWANARLRHLALYRDPALGLSVALGVNLPTTILYDAKGRELWRVTGGMDWAGADARRLIAEAAGAG